MANTVHGPYTFTNWTGTTPISTANLTTALSQAGIALHSFNPYLVTAGYVVYGVACVKDATTASKLNILSGEAFLIMTDGTIALIDVATTSQTTVTTNTTYYLDLNPDGTWSWATSHSAQTNYLPICQVTTDGSGNISGVSDKRVMRPQLLTNSALMSAGQPGGAQLPAPLSTLITQNAALAGQVISGVTFGQVGALAASMDGAALFSGSNYISLPTTSLPTGNASWTLEGWFKTSASGINGFLWDFGTNASKQGGQLYVNTANKLVGGFNLSALTSSGTVNNGAWHHAAVTWDGTNLTLYLDGAVVAGPTAGLGPGAITLGTASIGFQASFGGNGFVGALDECALYGAALSSTRIAAHYNAGISATTDAYATTVLADAPLRYYRLGDAVGSTTAVATISPTATTVVNADGTLAVSGIAGQGTAGAFGVPVIVAQASNVAVTVTTQVTVLSFTPSVTGMYRASLHYLVRNTGSNNLTARVSWTDPTLGTSFNVDFVANSNLTPLDGSHVVGGTIPLATMPIAFMAKAGQTIQVYVQDPTNTPNDLVTAILERLS